jgi:transposase, IS30 family
MRIGTKLAHKMNYTQLSYEQRFEIYALLKAGLNQTNIAKIVGVSKSTISREMKPNSGLKGYRPKQANERALDRRKHADKHVRFNAQIKKVVKKHLEQDWSPEQI